MLFALVTGCSSIAVHNPLTRIEKTPIELSYCINSSSEMNLTNKTFSAGKNKAEFENNIKQALDDVADYVESTILKSDYLNVTALPVCLNNITDNDNIPELYLTINLLGYGSMTKEFKKNFFALGVAEGVVQGIVVTSATQNYWLGFGVATEEILSEYLALNGIDWIFGENYAPVTLGGKLISSTDKKVIWQNSYFVANNEDELTEDEKKDKLKKLRASLHKAEKKLVSNLNHYLQKEIL